MEVQINLEELRKHKIFLGVPMYGGNAAGFFVSSVINLFLTFQKYGLHIRPYFLMNESLITRARNYIADEFLRSDCTHLLFIDSDISFSPEDVILLLHYSVTEDDKDIICGPYPKKNISWEKIKKAVDDGHGDVNPNNLERFSGDFVLNQIVSGQFRLDKPIEVKEAGTGFMLIKRKVFEDFSAAYPELQYYPNHKRNKEFSGDRKITGFFMDPIDEETHLSEDYFFCRWARKIGKKVWLCPWMKLDHIGTYKFRGDLSAVLAAGMSPTIGEKDVGKV